MKSLLTAVAATLVVSSLAATAAEARGLRIGFGFGVGVGMAMGAYGAGQGNWSRRSEDVVGGRSRCCADRDAGERAPRKARREDREDREERKIIRKKPVDNEETKVAARKHKPKVVASAPAAPAAAAAKASVAATDPALTSPGIETAQSLALGSAAAAGVGEARIEADAKASTPDAERMTADLSRQLQREPSVEVREAPAAEKAASTVEHNCRKYFPALGRSLAVSCYE